MRGRAAILLLVLLVAPAARAQVSPGELSAAHAHLEGNRHCTDCHGLGHDSLDPRCRDCHGGIAFLQEQDRGLHAGKESCSDCHPEHAGRDFQLIEWPDGSAEAFDHVRAGWPLQGAHARLECDRCHQAGRRTGEAARRAPRPEAVRWIGLDPDCVHCHQDVHRGALGGDCLSCHGQEAWRPVGNFDHARTGYPLDGRHATVDCAACHDQPRLGATVAADGTVARLLKPLPHADCSPCHADPHPGRFTGACSGCHVTAGFAVMKGGGFDHSRTRYPLRGRHVGLDCATCHDEQKAFGARPAFDRCDRCHAPAHGGQLAGRDCAPCHDEKGFRPSRFTVASHARTDYPLEGRHAQADCRACHAVADPPDSLSKAGWRFEPPFQRCTDCHGPAHGAELASGRDCGECHDLSGWRPSTFDAARHARTGLPLQGAHAGLECRRCHGPQRPGLRERAVDAGKAKVLLASTEKKCADCHLDPHGGRWEDCAPCHDPERFVPARFGPREHAERGWPLDGAHRAVPCLDCHPALGAPPAASTLVAGGGRPRDLRFAPAKGKARRDCRDCHAGDARILEVRGDASGKGRS